MIYINEIEKKLGIKLQKIMKDIQLGDFTATSVNTYNLKEWNYFKTETHIKLSVNKFINWY